MDNRCEYPEIERYLDELSQDLRHMPDSEREAIRDEAREHLHALAEQFQEDEMDRMSAAYKALINFGDTRKLGRNYTAAWLDQPERRNRLIQFRFGPGATAGEGDDRFLDNLIGAPRGRVFNLVFPTIGISVTRLVDVVFPWLLMAPILASCAETTFHMPSPPLPLWAFGLIGLVMGGLSGYTRTGSVDFTIRASQLAAIYRDVADPFRVDSLIARKRAESTRIRQMSSATVYLWVGIAMNCLCIAMGINLNQESNPKPHEIQGFANCVLLCGCWDGYAITTGIRVRLGLARRAS